MARRGFIHDKLDIKLLILFLMSRTATPINFATLTELTLCDDGFDYFDYAECLAELVSSEHITLTGGLYEITEKGRRNGGHGESSLPYSVRLKCEKSLEKLNPILRRNAQVRAEVHPRDDGFFTLCLSLDDDEGNLLTLEMLTASTEQAAQLGKRFRDMPELVYNGILNLLTGSDEDRKQPPAVP